MNRNRNTVRNITFIAALAASSLAFADHMSPMGEDWVDDAMDVHDARIDSLDDATISGNEFLADSMLETGSSFDTMPGMSDSALGGMSDSAVGGGRR